MINLRNAKRTLMLLAMIVMPVAVHSTTCVPFEKQVSVDGGVTWFDADTQATAPTQVVGGTVEYRFIVKNCETNKDCFDTTIADPTLNIVDALVREEAIVPGEEIVIESDTVGFENLLQADRCDTPGLKENTATETTFVQGHSVPETMMDNAWVNCVAPDTASLGDRVWLDDGDGIQNCTTDADGSGIIGDNVSDCSDTGVDGVTVTLGQFGTQGCVLGGPSTTTMNGGFYLFTDLDPGNYCVAFVKPAGLECTTDNVLDEGDGRDSDGVDAGTICLTDPVALEAGDTNLTVDLGLVMPPQTASLGDRVWEDLNGDGVQNCTDGGANDPMNPADDIIGNAGDSGPECGAAVPGVTVNLLRDCTSVEQSATTDANGFYGFNGLADDEYCVQFDLTTVAPDFCATDGFDLGAPLFTTANQGDDALDSDANVETGVSDSVMLAGVDNLTLDAGIVCPAKIGDQVWLDTDGDGTQNEAGTGVDNVTVELFSCGPDGMKGGVDDFTTDEMRTTDMDGMYMFGAESDYALPPGCYFLTFTDPEGRAFTMPGIGDDETDSDCSGPMGMTAAINVGGRSIDLSNDCGLVPPQPDCDLVLDKSCRVETPPTPAFEGSCKGKLQEFTVIWNGNGPVTAGGQTIIPGEAATFTGPFDNNDVIIDVFGESPDETGFSVFHMSCSDDDFDGPEDCGMPAGDGKGNDSGALNLWALEGFRDAENRVLDCNTGPSEGEFLQSCTFEAPTPRSCENSEKPRKLVFEYTGGGCGASDNGQSADKAVCDADVPLNDADVTSIMASGDDKFENDIYNVTYDGNLQVGDRLTIDFNGDRFKSTSFIQLASGGASETNEFHTSCSQPLAIGDVFGSLTLVGWDDFQDGIDVTYRYDVTNLGDPLTNVIVRDDPLGDFAIALINGAGSLEVAERISATTTNTATARGLLSNGTACLSNSDTVTVESVVPPCDVSFELDKVEDDNLKIKLTNNDARNRVVELQSLEVSFPGDRMDIREVKLDGAIYKRDDSNNPINGTPATIGPDGWTKSDATKRQLDPGERRTLEIKTTKKSDKDDAVFEVTLTFGPDCIYKLVIANKQIVSVESL